MSTTETVHDRIRHATAELAPRLWDVAQELHPHPELAFEEHRAAALLSKELDSEGFTVERGVAGMETAFTARAGNGGGPVSRSCWSTTPCRTSATRAATT